ncbi:MAG: cytochrome c peroxidase [Aestuariivirga sp.]
MARNKNPRHCGAKGVVALVSALFGLVLVLARLTSAVAQDNPFWSSTEVYTIKSLSIAALRPLRPNSTNRVADDPQAAALGKSLFFDPRFSANGAVSCSSCHVPDHQFQDDLRVGHGIADVTRRTMPLAGTSYYPFFFWDGRKDSQWSQALGPLESPAEHGADRTMIAQLIAANYRADYEAVFGNLPDFGKLPAHAAPAGAPEAVSAWQALAPEQQRAVNMTFANMGKAIEAFERTIPVPLTRFDSYSAALVAKDDIAANNIFTETERNGLKLFLNQGNCMSCHKGPLFTDLEFYNLGLPGTSAATDIGNSAAVYALKDDPFNCLGEFSDDTDSCLRNKMMQFDLPNQVGAFKSPSLRGVAQRPPYMHNGQFATLHEVMVHYNNAPKAPFGESRLPYPRKMTDQQLSEIEAFIKTLNVND